MRNKILYVRILVVLIVAIMAIFSPPPYVYRTTGIVSDAVTAPNPHQLTPEQQQQGIEALQKMIG